MNTLEFSLDDLVELKEAYEVAHQSGAKVFSFKGCELLVSYAKYLIEYLETCFGEKK